MSKVLVIGLDGASLDLIERFTAEDKLTTFRFLMKEGSYGRLNTVIPPVTAPAWASFITGMNPGKHGVYDFVIRKEKTNKWTPVTSLNLENKNLWRYLSLNGKKVILVNVPLTYPPPTYTEITVSGFPAIDINKKIVHPQNLFKEIENYLENYPVELKETYTGSNEKEVIEEINRRMDSVFELAKYLIKNKQWDFFMTFFQITDAIQHWFWKFMDKNHPDFDPIKAQSYGDAILNAYKRVDRYISEIIRLVDEETYIFIISDHGFGPIYKAVYINNLLYHFGFLKFKKDIYTKIKLFLFKLGFNLYNAYHIGRRLKLEALFRKESTKTNSRAFRILNKVFLSFNDIDWDRTFAYSRGNFGQIYLNMVDREPKGIVTPKIKDKILNDLISKLSTVADKSGNKIFKKIIKKEDIYKGKCITFAPELIVEPVEGYYVTRFFEFASNKVTGPHPRWSGGHRIDGITFVKGPKIKKGYRISPKSILSVPPTIITLFNLESPEWMDGSIIHEIFEP